MQHANFHQQTTLAKGIFERGFTFVTGVPDSEFKTLITELEANELGKRYVLATREDNAVSLAVGAYLAGERPLVFMESSGIGNAVDVLTSLAITYEIPMVLFIAWAGYKGRDVVHHNAIGEPLKPLLDVLGIESIDVVLDEHDPNSLLDIIEKALELANAQSSPVAVLGIPKKFAEGDF
ncbi:thiamine pyrophosphate-binding protein [Thermoflavimicrobium daqui]|uniref:Thiamine pyrophosphate enzyme N-terminal TPP-binding domain-containing protein n=1 Tax=Thermoflavimicrobium daqui TaxID=2137476 RepID=A0A364K4M2_9BACL|nr:thiamine pyrophosphate-binding protein [Thermoflavimicrobium daqui]RAL24241.1 hypothetical protein DL897_11215 [Thermoflavimicrobium daqui]